MLLIQLKDAKYHLINPEAILLVHLVLALLTKSVQRNIQIRPILLDDIVKPQLVGLYEIAKRHHNVVGNLYHVVFVKHWLVLGQ
jgi:hypothetical protein